MGHNQAFAGEHGQEQYLTFHEFAYDLCSFHRSGRRNQPVFNGLFESNATRSDAPDGWTAAGNSAVTVRDILGNRVDAKVAVLSETTVYLFGANADLVERALP